MKKNYTQPKITRVKLDPEQAILVVCQVGGGYFMGTTVCADRGGAILCLQTVRHVSAQVGTSLPTSTMPS